MTKTDLTFNEVCKILNRSRRTVSRYINEGLIKPKIIGSQKGTSKYLFDPKEVENINISGKVDRKGKTGHKTRQDMAYHDTEVITLLKDQLKIKDKQITNLQGKIDKLIERQRETNYLIKGLSDKILMIESKTKSQEREDKTGHQKNGTSSKIKQFFGRWFNKP
jgi:DNA-binding transcriptional MerR regulator